MSLWTIGLGVSVGYLIFKRGKLSDAVEQQVREYKASEQLDSYTSEGISHHEIMGIKKDIAFHKKEVFNEKLAPQDRRAFEQAEEAFEQEALEFDKGPNVTGVYLDELRYG